LPGVVHRLHLGHQLSPHDLPWRIAYWDALLLPEVYRWSHDSRAASAPPGTATTSHPPESFSVTAALFRGAGTRMHPVATEPTPSVGSPPVRPSATAPVERP